MCGVFEGAGYETSDKVWQNITQSPGLIIKLRLLKVCLFRLSSRASSVLALYGFRVSALVGVRTFSFRSLWMLLRSVALLGHHDPHQYRLWGTSGKRLFGLEGHMFQGASFQGVGVKGVRL